MGRSLPPERYQEKVQDMIGKRLTRITPEGVIIKDPDMLARLRLSPEAAARIEQLERPSPWRPPIVMD